MSTTSRPGDSPAQERLGPLARVKGIVDRRWRRAIAPQPQANPEARRAFDQKRQVERKDVVVFEHVRVACSDCLNEGLDQVRLAQRTGIHHRMPAAAVAHADHEDAVALLVQARRLEIELEASQVAERHALEVRPTGKRQELLDRIPGQNQAAQVRQALRIAPVTLIRHLDQCRLDFAEASGQNEVAVDILVRRVGPVELDDDQRLGRVKPTVGGAQGFGSKVPRR